MLVSAIKSNTIAFELLGEMFYQGELLPKENLMSTRLSAEGKHFYIFTYYPSLSRHSLI